MWISGQICMVLLSEPTQVYSLFLFSYQSAVVPTTDESTDTFSAYIPINWNQSSFLIHVTHENCLRENMVVVYPQPTYESMHFRSNIQINYILWMWMIVWTYFWNNLLQLHFNFIADDDYFCTMVVTPN